MRMLMVGRAIAVPLMSLVLTTCAGDPRAEDQAPMVIGSLLPLSGADKSFGQTEQRAMQIAVDEINADGGIDGRRLEVDYADTALDEHLAEREYTRLVRHRRVPLIQEVTGSGIALRLAPRATADRVVLVSSIDTSPKLSGASPYFFRTIASDDHSARALASWLSTRAVTAVALVSNRENSWSQGLAGAVRRALADVAIPLVAESEVDAATEDFAPAVAALARARRPVQAVVVALMGQQAGHFVAAAAAAGLPADFFGTDTFSQQEFIDNSGAGRNRTFFVMPGGSRSPAYARFAEAYQRRYGVEPDSVAAKAYDAVHVTALALRQASKRGDVTGPKVRDHLAGTSYSGVTGLHAFDGNGDLREAAIERFRYVDGRRTAAD